MSEPKFTVAICGGGICGLTAAIAIANLSRDRDIHIDVYEAARAFTEIGAGVTVWRRPWQVLSALGLTEDLLKIASSTGPANEPTLAFRMRKSDQPTGVHYYDMVIPTGGLSFHRADFLNCLVSHLDAKTTTTHFSKRLSSYTNSANTPRAVTLSFTDGSSAVCDLLIGADGIHSPTRHTMLENAARELEQKFFDDGKERAEMLRKKKEPIWSGIVSYRAIIPSEKLREINPGHRAFASINAYTGRDRHIICYPIAQGRYVNFVALCFSRDKAGTIYEGKLVEECSKEELTGRFVDWEEEVLQLLQCVNEKLSRWIINTVDNLPINIHGLVALAGDAAHAMEPHQGSGAGQAMEDAYILGALLTHPQTTCATLRRTIEVYQQVRLPRANDVQRRSVINGQLYAYRDARFAHFVSPDGLSTRSCTSEDAGRLWEIGHAAVENWKWAWTTSIEDERRHAIDLLEEKIGASSEAQ